MPNKFLWFIASVINIFMTTFEEFVHVISEVIYFYCAEYTWPKESVLWDRNNLTCLIVLWQNYPNLYDRTHADFRNQDRRHISLVKIAKKLREQGMPEINIDDVKKKLRCLRTQYKIELNMMDKSKKFAKTTDDIYVPKWEYFTLLSFLHNHVGEMSFCQNLIAKRKLRDSFDESDVDTETFNSNADSDSKHDDSTAQIVARVNKTLLCQQTRNQINQTDNDTDSNNPKIEFPAIEDFKNDEPSTKSLTPDNDESPSWQISSSIIPKDDRHLDQFTTLLFKEITGIKRKNVIRKLKKDMMDLVYKAQEDDEKNLDY